MSKRPFWIDLGPDDSPVYDLSEVPRPDLVFTRTQINVVGFRLAYKPVTRRTYKPATGVAFNLDTACPPP